MSKIARFDIDPEFLTDVTIFRYTDGLDKKKPEELTNEELINLMKNIRSSVTYSIDHPEFTKLRETLGSQGFIHIERGWCNGDRVLKEFYLNEAKYEIGDQFSSAVAQGVSHRIAQDKLAKKFTKKVA